MQDNKKIKKEISESILEETNTHQEQNSTFNEKENEIIEVTLEDSDDYEKQDTPDLAKTEYRHVNSDPIYINDKTNRNDCLSDSMFSNHMDKNEEKDTFDFLSDDESKSHKKTKLV